jgi:GT2 family glycosyltransferase
MPPDGGISVVIPTKDRADLLAVTLRSVREQSLSPAEVIVVDDGSTDSTEDVVREAGARLVRNSQGGWGAARARNAGLAQAHTEYVSFLDSDDLFHPRALERLHAALSAKPRAPFAYGWALAARPDSGGWVAEALIGPVPGEPNDALLSLFARNFIPSGAGMVRTEAARRIGGYNPDLVYSEDHVFWIQLSQLGGPLEVPEVVCVHRRHAGNRHSPHLAFRVDAFINALADEDVRLSPGLPERSGVQLCELLIDAGRERDARTLWAALDRLLLRRPRKLRVLRSAIKHFGVRRRLGRSGREVFSRDPALQEWLSSY